MASPADDGVWASCCDRRGVSLCRAAAGAAPRSIARRGLAGARACRSCRPRRLASYCWVPRRGAGRPASAFEPPAAARCTGPTGIAARRDFATSLAAAQMETS
ncbi:unnamed protein product [Pelagomonas calceolata]|uniref:Uncharacterized protein n=1 Tax=Pelagomonas calceolata TaxID=35677 RepID=A0A8J2SW82_9STRA|nr:unnamed protein product [Pelagomonas calceolata]